MNGADIGELTVQIEEGDNTSMVWRKQGNQGSEWRRAIVTLSSQEAFWVKFSLYM